MATQTKHQVRFFSWTLLISYSLFLVFVICVPKIFLLLYPGIHDGVLTLLCVATWGLSGTMFFKRMSQLSDLAEEQDIYETNRQKEIDKILKDGK